MNIADVINELGLEVICGSDKAERTVRGAYVSDLLSDVMGRAREGEIWITLQTHKNIVAVALLKELSAILIVNGGRPDHDALASAEAEDIIILGTAEKSFTVAGKLYKFLEKHALV